MRSGPTQPLPSQHPVPTAYYDEHFRIVMINEAWTRLTGLTLDEVRGRDGIDVLHPEDRELARVGMAMVLADGRRDWPAAFSRVPNGRGGWTAIATHLGSFEPEDHGIRYAIGLTDASLHVAMNRLIDVLAAGRGIAAVLDCAIGAAESTGHYCASFIHRRGFTAGRYTDVVAGPLREHVDLRAPKIETLVANACRTGTPQQASVAELGIEQPPVVEGKQLVQCVAFPFSVKGEAAGALCVWGELEGQLGPFGAAHVARVARLSGEAISNQIDFDAASPARRVGDLQFDLVRRSAIAEGRTVRLTPIEASILDLLSEVPGRTVTRERIITQLFGSTHTGGSRTCDTHVRNLRAKLHDDPAQPRFIATVRGEGYALVLGDSVSCYRVERDGRPAAR